MTFLEAGRFAALRLLATLASQQLAHSVQSTVHEKKRRRLCAPAECLEMISSLIVKASIAGMAL